MKKNKTDKSNFLDLQLSPLEVINPEDFICDDDKKKELATLVIKNINNPLDKWAVCATLNPWACATLMHRKSSLPRICLS